MLVLVIVTGFGGLAGLVALGLGLLSAGLRAGDRPGEATVAAMLAEAGQPDERRPVVIVTVRNPGDSPLMAGFTAGPLRLPGVLGVLGGMTVRVPRRTVRRRFLAAAHDVVGVVPPAGEAEFVLPVAAAARRYRVTAVIGQSAGRLRVFRMPVQDRYSAGPSALFPTLDDGRLT